MMGFPLLIVKPNFYCPDADGRGLSVCLEKDYCSAVCITSADGLVTTCPTVRDSGETTIATDFQLYCDRSYLTGLLGSVLFFGNSKNIKRILTLV